MTARIMSEQSCELSAALLQGETSHMWMMVFDLISCSVRS